MRFLTPAFWLLLASPAFAQDTLSPRDHLAEALTHDIGEATWWLIGTALAMFVALYAVQKSVYRKK